MTGDIKRNSSIFSGVHGPGYGVLVRRKAIAAKVEVARRLPVNPAAIY